MVNFMRKVLISGVMIFLALSAIPFLTLKAVQTRPNPSDISTEKTEFTTSDTAKENTIKSAADLGEEGFCDEGLKCALVIAKNNLNSAQCKDSTEYKEYPEEYYRRLERLYDEADLTLQYNEKIVYIPTSSLSKGFTEEDSQYPYIKSVASPWDCLDNDFVYDKEYSKGISMKGLNYLCENGMNFKEALSWYLPEFSIK